MHEAGRFYNAGVFKDKRGELVVLARQVRRRAVDEPDSSPLVMMTGQHEWIPWIPGDQGIDSLEDARMMGGSGGLVSVGLTAVFKAGDAFEAYPAMVHGPIGMWWKMPDVKVIDRFGPGKNTTPMGEDRVVFRPDGWNHNWLVVDYNNGKARKVAEIDLSRGVPEWGTHRMGTGIPPIWLSREEALMVVHGMTYDPERDFYTYSLGRARLRVLDRGRYKIDVHPRPILTVDQFSGHPQLHPELRAAKYVTGGYLLGDKLILLVNVGDCRTEKVSMQMADLVRWD